MSNENLNTLTHCYPAGAQVGAIRDAARKQEGIYDLHFPPSNLAGFESFDLDRLKPMAILYQTGYLTMKGKDEDGLILLDYPIKEKFFDRSQSRQMGNIDFLAGTKQFKEQIMAGKKEKEIRKSWEPGLSKYKEMRKKYLL
jgi:hypothetical protein